MLTRYVEPRATRFVREVAGGIEQIRIPMRRNWFVLLFFSFWLCGWTIGGIAVIGQVVTDFDWFLIFWLGMWALGWAFAATTIATQIAGSEIIRVTAGNLEISVGAGRLRRRKVYRGGHIRYLDSSDPNPMGLEWWAGWGRGWRSPLGPWRAGAIKFDYGSETVYAATSVDEPDGRAIVEWLRPRLPRSASDLQAPPS